MQVLCVEVPVAGGLLLQQLHQRGLHTAALIRHLLHLLQQLVSFSAGERRGGEGRGGEGRGGEGKGGEGKRRERGGEGRGREWGEEGRGGEGKGGEGKGVGRGEERL